MKKIKDYLIHLLGGCTQSEKVAKGASEYSRGYHFAFTEVFEYMKAINGLSAEDWCADAWKYINAKCQSKT